MNKKYRAGKLEEPKAIPKQKINLSEKVKSKLDSVVLPIESMMDKKSLVSLALNPEFESQEILKNIKKYLTWSKEELINELARLKFFMEVSESIRVANNELREVFKNSFFKNIEDQLAHNKSRQDGKTNKFSSHTLKQEIAKSILTKMLKERGALSKNDARDFYKLMRAECSKANLSAPSQGTLLNYFNRYSQQ